MRQEIRPTAESGADKRKEAAELALATGLRSSVAIHLAAALTLPGREVTLATRDARLHGAARQQGLTVLPASLAA